MKRKILLLVNLFLPFVVFSQTLHSISPSGANAGETLTVSITGKGTKFKQASGTTVILGVNGAVTNSVTTVHDSLIQASITIPPNANTGDYDVTVTQVTVISRIMIKAFHVNGVPTPVLKAITPTIATNGQTLDVTITGGNTHFNTNGNNVVEFGFGQGSGTTVANSTTPVSDTILKASITIPAKVYNGTYPVYVKNSTDGSMVLQNVFQINGNPRPELASLNPKNGTAGKTLDVTITGRFTHYNAGSNTVNFGFTAASGTTVVNSTTVLSDTTIKVNITIPASTAPGDYGVSVKNSIDGNMDLLMGFHVNPGQQPLIVNINPKSATTNQTLDVTITGAKTHFKSAGTSVIFGFFAQASGTVINSLTPVNDSSIVVNMTIPPNIKIGDYNVTVNNAVDGLLTINNGFRINQSSLASLSSISPATGNAGQTLTVTIRGVNTHFGTTNGTAAAFYFARASGTITIAANSVTVSNDTTLTAAIIIPADVFTGDYDFSVKNTTDGPSPMYGHGFHVNGIAPPLGVSATPNTILAGETGNITIIGNGAHFNSPASKTAVNFIGDRTIIINSKTVLNDSVIALSITAPAIGGGYRIEVTDSIDGKRIGFFKVYPKCFAFFKTTYDVPTNVFSLTLDSTSSKAKSFHWDFGDGTTSTDSFPSHVFTEDKIYNVCLQITNIAGDSCRYCHEIGKDSLGNPIFKTKGFSMYAKPYKELITGIPSNDTDEHFIAVYPNPADNFITIMSSTPISALNKPVLFIYSIEGRLLLQQAFVKEKMVLDISAFQRGMYIMQLTGSKQTEIIKFTKE
jgi:hypothetical protein